LLSSEHFSRNTRRWPKKTSPSDNNWPFCKDRLKNPPAPNGSAVLDMAFKGLDGLAVLPGHCQTGDGHCMASQRLQAILAMEVKKGRRPEIDKEIRNRILRMSLENPTWGAPRIHSELALLGYELVERTISSSRRTWRLFRDGFYKSMLSRRLRKEEG